VKEGFENGGTLHVGSHDNGVLTEVQKEGLACPAANRLDNVKGNTSEEELEGATNSDAMALEARGA
jgi:hypothetical protein